LINSIIQRAFSEILVASKIVSRDVRQAGLVDHILGAHGEVNVQGEEQQMLMPKKA
jgi:fructose-1,6-bisphosphatase